MEILRDAPSLEDFTPLAEHQSQTPGSFFGGKPVLHLHSPNSQLLISKHDLEAQAAFTGLHRKATAANGDTPNGHSDDARPSEQVSVPDIDIWVTSETLILFSTTTKTGVAIPYPTIFLHAIQSVAPDSGAASRGLYLQLSLTDLDQTNSDDDDIETLELTLIPSSSAPSASSSAPPTSSTPPPAPAPAQDAAAAAPPSPIQALYDAITACQELHPTAAPPGSDDEGTGGMPAGLPGAGGWITADNMHDFFDADGHFVGAGGGALGAGAGTVREREEDVDVDEGDEGEREGDGDGDGAGGEAKWQRTG